MARVTHSAISNALFSRLRLSCDTSTARASRCALRNGDDDVTCSVNVPTRVKADVPNRGLHPLAFAGYDAAKPADANVVRAWGADDGSPDSVRRELMCGAIFFAHTQDLSISPPLLQPTADRNVEPHERR